MTKRIRQITAETFLDVLQRNKDDMIKIAKDVLSKVGNDGNNAVYTLFSLDRWANIYGPYFDPFECGLDLPPTVEIGDLEMDIWIAAAEQLGQDKVVASLTEVKNKGL